MILWCVQQKLAVGLKCQQRKLSEEGNGMWREELGLAKKVKA